MRRQPIRKSHQVALFTQVAIVADAAAKLGKRIKNIAVYDVNKLPEVLEQFTSNHEQPGAFADFVIQVYRKRDKRGRERCMVRSGRVMNALIRWSEECPNLMHGWKRESMAKALQLNVNDQRVNSVAKQLTKICKEIGVEAGWDGRGFFRVFTIREHNRKQKRRRAQVENIVKRGEEASAVLRERGYLPSGKKAIEQNLWEVEGLDDDDAEGQLN